MHILHLRLVTTGAMRQDQINVGQAERGTSFNNKIGDYLVQISLFLCKKGTTYSLYSSSIFEISFLISSNKEFPRRKGHTRDTLNYP